jgi:hypothetical protein
MKRKWGKIQFQFILWTNIFWLKFSLQKIFSSFVVPVLVTSIGISVSLYGADYFSINRVRKNVVNILEAIKEQIGYQKNPLDTALEEYKKTKEKEVDLRAVPPFEPIGNIILESDNTLSVIHPESYTWISVLFYDINFSRGRVENASSPEERGYYLASLIHHVDVIKDVIDIEIKRLKREINLQDLKGEHEKLRKKRKAEQERLLGELGEYTSKPSS